MQTNSAPLISVVIPCYRQAHYLDEAIKSVLAQTHRRLEIIVVDDGSPDDTSEVAARHPRARLIRQPHLGLPAARNAGLRASLGEHTVFLDADDRLVPDALETGISALAAAPECALVYGFCEFIDHAGAPIPTPPQVPAGGDCYRALFRKNYIMTPGAAMFRRAVLASVAGFDESFTGGCEDIDLYLRVARRWPIQCHGRVVLQYRQHRASMSSKRMRMLRASNDLFRKHLREVKGDPELEEICRNKIVRYFAAARVVEAARVRTRLRAFKSFFGRTRQAE